MRRRYLVLRAFSAVVRIPGWIAVILGLYGERLEVFVNIDVIERLNAAVARPVS